MAKQLQLRRGTTSQHSSFTGLVGEVTVDTDKDTVVVHDGSTAGGKALVTDPITTLGTVTAGVLNSGVTGGSGLDPNNLRSCRMWLTTYISNSTANVHLNFTGWTQDYNNDTSLFTQGSTSSYGITVAEAGMYNFSWSIYGDSPVGADGYVRGWLVKDATDATDGTRLESSGIIHFQEGGEQDTWLQFGRSGVVSIGTGTYSVRMYLYNQTWCINPGNGGVSFSLTRIRDN